MSTATTTKRTPAPSKAERAQYIRRRRAVMMEAGLEHAEAAEIIAKRFKIPTTRQAITNAINGHFTSAGGRIESAVINLVRERLTLHGQKERAETVTPEFLGWSAVIDGAG